MRTAEHGMWLILAAASAALAQSPPLLPLSPPSAVIGAGPVRRPISDDWILHANLTYSTARNPALAARMKQALAQAAEQRRPPQVELAVDTNQDGRADAWVYFAAQSPAFVELDRFDTGCHDLRLDVAAGNTQEFTGWTTEPPVPLPGPAPGQALAALFDWAGASRLADGSPRVRRALDGSIAELPAAAAALAGTSDAKPVEELERAAQQAQRRVPQMLAVHRDEQFAEKLKTHFGYQVKYLFYDWGGGPELETAVGFAPWGVYAIQTFDGDARLGPHGPRNRDEPPSKLVSEVVFEDDKLARIDLAEQRYLAVAGHWLKVAPAARREIAERLLVPGWSAFRGGDWYAALVHWQSAARLAGALGDYQLTPENVAEGDLERRRGDPWRFAASGLPADELLEYAKELGFRSDTPNLDRLGAAAAADRRWAEALDWCRLALRLSDKMSASREKVFALETLAHIHRRLGNCDRAIECLLQSLDVQATLDYAVEMAKNVEMLINDTRNPVQHKTALEARSHSLAIDRIGKLGLLAALHLELGEREAAAGFLAEAERGSKLLGHRHLQADLLGLRGTLDVAEGRFEAGLARLERAYELTQDGLAWQRETEFGREMLDAGKTAHMFAVAGDGWREDYFMRADTHPASYNGLAAGQVADALLYRTRWPDLAAGEREKLLKQAAEWQARAAAAFRQAKDDAGLLADQFRQSLLAIESGDLPRGRRLAEAAMKSAKEQEAWEIEWRAAALLAVVLDRQSQPAAAIAAGERAVSLIESQRAMLFSEPARRGFFSSKVEIYETLAHLQWKRDPAAAEAIWRTIERAKARALLDLVGGESLDLSGSDVVELRRKQPELYFSLPGVAGRRVGALQLGAPDAAEALASLPHLQEAASLAVVKPVALADVQKLLGPDDLLLEYFVMPGDLLAVAIRQGGIAVHRLAGWGEERMRSEVEAYRRILEQPGSRYEPQAKKLHAALVAPCLGKPPRRLIVVPGGALTYLPVATLMNDAGRFLVEDMEVSYATSASALVFAHRRRALQTADPQFADLGRAMLVVANPKPQLGFAPLPFALLEGETLAATNDEATLLAAEQATESAVRAALGRSRYVHFAGHTDLSPTAPLRAALMCAEEIEHDGRLEVREIFGLNLRRCELAVLSACETRLGRWSRGDEVVGLERAFLRAGVPTVIGSLWKVDDASTQVLMETLYDRHWNAGRSKSAALREAQLAVLRGSLDTQIQTARRGLGAAVPLVPRDPAAGGDSSRHPFYWAAFVLSGAAE